MTTSAPLRQRQRLCVDANGQSLLPCGWRTVVHVALRGVRSSAIIFRRWGSAERQLFGVQGFSCIAKAAGSPACLDHAKILLKLAFFTFLLLPCRADFAAISSERLALRHGRASVDHVSGQQMALERLENSHLNLPRG